MKFIQHLLYAGMTKEEYDAVSDSVVKDNLSQLTIYTMITLGILVLLTWLSMNENTFGGRNRMIYFVSALVCACIAWRSIHLNGRNQRTISILVSLFEIVLYLIGIAVSVRHADLPGVSEIAFLLIVPLLFVDRPIIITLKTLAVAVIFCIVTSRVKTPAIATVDIYNTMVYSVAAIAIGIFITEMKMQSFAQKERITFLSEMDVLTGVRNRNSYELTVSQLPVLCKETVTCIYGDVNGLHELNNTKGHDAGDRMLQAVAAAMKKYFGEEYLFRIGGDEFVVIRIDMPPMTDELDKVMAQISTLNYHMSFGYSTMSRNDLNPAVLIRQAEEMMYREKEEYYRETGKAGR